MRPSSQTARAGIKSAEILGVSHIVVGVNDLQPAEQCLMRHGYSVKNRAGDEPNPVQKAAFVRGALTKEHDIELLASPIPTPLIELVRPKGAARGAVVADASPVYEVILGEAEDHGETLEDSSVREAIENGEPAGINGLTMLPGSAGVLCVVARVIRCKALDQSLEIWRDLTIDPRQVAAGMARVDIAGPLPGNRLAFFLMEDEKRKDRAYLDEAAVACPSMICKDASRLAESLDAKGHDVCERFAFSPFGLPLEIFFARTPSGELYEFLSLGRGGRKH